MGQPGCSAEFHVEIRAWVLEGLISIVKILVMVMVRSTRGIVLVTSRLHP